MPIGMEAMLKGMDEITTRKEEIFTKKALRLICVCKGNTLLTWNTIKYFQLKVCASILFIIHLLSLMLKTVILNTNSSRPFLFY